MTTMPPVFCGISYRRIRSGRCWVACPLSASSYWICLQRRTLSGAGQVGLPAGHQCLTHHLLVLASCCFHASGITGMASIAKRWLYALVDPLLSTNLIRMATGQRYLFFMLCWISGFLAYLWAPRPAPVKLTPWALQACCRLILRGALHLGATAKLWRQLGYVWGAACRCGGLPACPEFRSAPAMLLCMFHLWSISAQLFSVSLDELASYSGTACVVPLPGPQCTGAAVYRGRSPLPAAPVLHLTLLLLPPRTQRE
jgi:hypothetical protein